MLIVCLVLLIIKNISDKIAEKIKACISFSKTFSTKSCLLWYDMIWYDMIWYDIYIYLTAVGLTPGGSSTSHIYTQTVRIIQR
jgi:hypothetical protein